jgi:tRNA A-37 threonylcarbamoyl transferase component Bud32
MELEGSSFSKANKIKNAKKKYSPPSRRRPLNSRSMSPERHIPKKTRSRTTSIISSEMDEEDIKRYFEKKINQKKPLDVIARVRQQQAIVPDKKIRYMFRQEQKLLNQDVFPNKKLKILFKKQDSAYNSHRKKIDSQRAKHVNENRIKIAYKNEQEYNQHIYGSIVPLENIPVYRTNNISGKFSEQKFLGKGAFGTVTLVRRNKKLYVRKKQIIPFNVEYGYKNMLDLTISEIRAMRKLSGKNVCPKIVSYDIQNKRDCTIINIIMEFANRYAELADHVRIIKRLPASIKMGIIKLIVQKLIVIHKNKLIHNDIKPENILYNPETQDIKFIDFGLVSEHKASGGGTNAYMSPKHFDGTWRSATYGTDIWSMALVILELFTGYPSGTIYHENEILGKLPFRTLVNRLNSSISTYYTSQRFFRFIIECLAEGYKTSRSNRLATLFKKYEKAF